MFWISSWIDREVWHVIRQKKTSGVVQREDTYSSSGTQGQMVHLLGEGTHHVSLLHGDGVVHARRDHSTLWEEMSYHSTIYPDNFISYVMLSTKTSFTHLIRSVCLQLGPITGARRELFHFNKWNNAIQMRVMHTSAEMMHRPLNSRAARAPQTCLRFKHAGMRVLTHVR